MRAAGATTRARPTAPELDAAFDEPLGLDLARDHIDDPSAPLEGAYATEHDPGLRRYLRWQVRDFLKTRAVFLVPLAVLAVWIFRDNYSAAEVMQSLQQRGGTLAGQSTEAGVFREAVTAGGLLGGLAGAILAACGIVSRDRERGLQRFLFAKPVRMVSYYLQAFVVNGVGLLAVVAGALLLTSLVFMRPVPLVEPLLGAAAGYLAVGGLTFLISTLVRFDLALAGILTVLSIPLHAAAEQGKWWAVLTSWLLPPVHTLEAFFREGDRGGGLSAVASSIGTMAAYGVAYIGAGIAALRKRSIVG
jgi:hypothetical protein